MNGTATMPGSVRRGADFAWRRVRGSGAAGQRRYSQAGCFKECFKFNAFDMSHTTGGVLENAWASGRAGERGGGWGWKRGVSSNAKHNLEFRRATSYSSRETFVSKRTESSSLSLAL